MIGKLPRSLPGCTENHMIPRPFLGQIHVQPEWPQPLSRSFFHFYFFGSPHVLFFFISAVRLTRHFVGDMHVLISQKRLRIITGIPCFFYDLTIHLCRLSGDILFCFSLCLGDAGSTTTDIYTRNYLV